MRREAGPIRTRIESLERPQDAEWNREQAHRRTRRRVQPGASRAFPARESGAVWVSIIAGVEGTRASCFC
jgi:hypothetical protein